MISVDGAYDLHVHSSPCVYPRIGTDLEVARAAQQAGLSGLCLKCHHESTAIRAATVNQELSLQGCGGFRVFGSITLNHAVGGVSPAAVYEALRLGARIVWMPTVDSQAHKDVFGRTGSWDIQGSPAAETSSLPALKISSGGKLGAAARDVLKLCQEHDVALATGHLGKEEIGLLARFAASEKFGRLVVTHPLFKAPGLAPGDLAELAELGVYFEMTYCTISPMWRHATIDDTVDVIRRVGADRAFLSSDCGQPHNPWPHEGLRLIAQMCLDRGIPEPDVRQMISGTAAMLIS